MTIPTNTALATTVLDLPQDDAAVLARAHAPHGSDCPTKEMKPEIQIELQKYAENVVQRIFRAMMGDRAEPQTLPEFIVLTLEMHEAGEPIIAELRQNPPMELYAKLNAEMPDWNPVMMLSHALTENVEAETQRRMTRLRNQHSN